MVTVLFAERCLKMCTANMGEFLTATSCIKHVYPVIISNDVNYFTPGEGQTKRSHTIKNAGRFIENPELPAARYVCGSVVSQAGMCKPNILSNFPK